LQIYTGEEQAPPHAPPHCKIQLKINTKITRFPVLRFSATLAIFQPWLQHKILSTKGWKIAKENRRTGKL